MSYSPAQVDAILGNYLADIKQLKADVRALQARSTNATNAAAISPNTGVQQLDTLLIGSGAGQADDDGLILYNGPIVQRYVDGTNGNDANDGKSPTTQKQTIQSLFNYAVYDVPAGGIQVNVSGSVGSLDSIANVLLPRNNYLYIDGVPSTVKSGTVGVGSVAGTGATRFTLVDNAGGMTVNAYAGQFMNYNGVYVIESNTATTFTMVGVSSGGLAPTNGSNYTVTTPAVMSLGSILLGFVGNILHLQIDNMDLMATGSGENISQTNAVFNNCRFIDNTGAHNLTLQQANVTMNGCAGLYTGTNPGLSIAAYQSNLTLNNCLMKSSGGYGNGLQPNNGSIITMNGQNIIDGYNTGLNPTLGGQFLINNVAASGYQFIKNNATYGIRASHGGQTSGKTNNQYSGNGTNESADAYGSYIN
jgi:hypothetical protein